jgi:predicted AlkP superfamily pyrophosphatase or phosphodiesterase
VVKGDQRRLRERAPGTPENSPERPPILYLAMDGVSRDLLYDMLRKRQLPNLATLLGGAGAGGELPHAYLDEHLLSTLPSSTMAAWATAMTGVGPAEHGITGNEYFVREERLFACPAPVSFSDSKPTLEIFTDAYMDSLSAAPVVYERMREKDPNVLIWVGMHHLYRGADELLLTKRGVLASAFEGFIEVEAKKHLADKESRRLYAELDEAVVDAVSSRLGQGPVPDVLTLYLSGTDLYAHVAEEGPDAARRSYLAEVVDPSLARLIDALKARHALDRRWVVLTADHGHTAVVHDDAHALSTKKDEDPPSVLERIGFRVRPFARNVPEKDPFSAVLAYGGAMAYVYLADRSSCPSEKDVCDWRLPPRYEEDVLAAAEAFHKNDDDGSIVPPMRGTLDLILTRRPKPYPQVDAPFEVYVGHGKTVPVDAYLKEHAHPTYVSVDARLRDLAVGVHGERAGDILLLAHNGDRDKPEERYYFAAPYRSWHGSPSKQDSEIPLIVAHPLHASATIGAHVKRVLGERPFQQKVTDLLLGIRAGAFEQNR